jgi:Spy/CpxP family protein refolding chaperone
MSTLFVKPSSSHRIRIRLLSLSLTASAAIMPAMAFPAGSPSPSSGVQWDAAAPQKRDEHDDQFLKEMIRQLKLTPAQSLKVNTLARQAREKSAPLRAQVEQERRELSVYLKAVPATEAGAISRRERIHKQLHQLSLLRLKTWFAIRAQLTPAQLKRLGQLEL